MEVVATSTAPAPSQLRSKMNPGPGSARLLRLERAEQSVGLPVRPRGEEYGRGVRARREGEPPQPVDHGWVAGAIAHEVDEGAGTPIVGPDPTISEIADQEIVAERAEAGRRHGHGPRRVQVALARESLGERAIWIEDVDVAVPEPWGVILIVRRQLLGEGDVQLAPHGLNAEGS